MNIYINCVSIVILTMFGCNETRPLAMDAQSPHQDIATDNFPSWPLTDDQTVLGHWIRITPGEFLMGSEQNEPCRWDSETQHKVVLTKSFEIFATEVTRFQFNDLMGYLPGLSPSCNNRCPVVRVSWSEAAQYCNFLSEQKSLSPCYSCQYNQEESNCEILDDYLASNMTIYDCPGYRLPTEAEWEYAYRAGSQTAYYSGVNNPETCKSGDDAKADAIAWYVNNSNKILHPVGLKEPNNYGLFDMAGNAIEWTTDWYSNQPNSLPEINPWLKKPALDNEQIVIKGGAFHSPALSLRGAWRYYENQNAHEADTSFRCVRTIEN